MPKRSPGLFTFVTGMVAGAAAVFFSKPENRKMAEREIKKASRKAQKVKAEYKKDPEGFKTKVKTEGKKIARKAVRKASKKK